MQNGERWELQIGRFSRPYNTFIEHRLEETMEYYYNGRQFSVVRDITESGIIVRGMYQAVRLNGL